VRVLSKLLSLYIEEGKICFLKKIIISIVFLLLAICLLSVTWGSRSTCWLMGNQITPWEFCEEIEFLVQRERQTGKWDELQSPGSIKNHPVIKKGYNYLMLFMYKGLHWNSWGMDLSKREQWWWWWWWRGCVCVCAVIALWFKTIFKNFIRPEKRMTLRV